ncbi:MAG: NADH:flavin oxidoreductase, partial [Clostridiales bacterium]|nr:NADH:flavin oxidoreductase [Clostridiales bacterium]
LLALAGTPDAQAVRFLMQYKAEDPEEIFKIMNRGTKTVTLIESGKGIGRDIGPSTRWSMLMLLKQLGAKTMDQTRVVDLRNGSITVDRTEEDDEGNKKVTKLGIPADTLVLAAGYMPNAEIYADIEGQVDFLCLIGDAKKPGSMLDAVKQAYEEASVI